MFYYWVGFSFISAFACRDKIAAKVNMESCEVESNIINYFFVPMTKVYARQTPLHNSYIFAQR